MIDRSRECMLHSTASRSPGQMIDKQIGIKRAIIHPFDFLGCDPFQRIDDHRRLVVACEGVEYNTVFCPAMLEVEFDKLPELTGAVCQSIVIFRAQYVGARASRCSKVRGRERRSKLPIWRSSRDPERDRKFPPVDGIHQNFGEVEEGMMLVELGSERTSLVDDNVVIENNPPRVGTKLPARFVELPHGKLLS